jgi:murein L,D-transpeptidase YcbB/YkuD
MGFRPFALIAALALISACGPSREERQRSAEALRAALESIVSANAPPSFVHRDERAKKAWGDARRLYGGNDHQLLWGDGTRPGEPMDRLIAALNGAGEHGLEPSVYDPAALEAARESYDSSNAADTDVRFTYAYLRYAADVSGGAIVPSRIDRTWQAAPPDTDAAAALQSAVRENRIGESLEDLAPASAPYKGLKQQLARYRAIHARGGWPIVPDLPALRVGQRHPGVAILRQRLSASGDLAESSTAADLVDEPLIEALRAVQARHGLAADGRYTPEVAAELNVTVEDRMEQIGLNMDRWRWLPHDLGERYLLVNIPAFRLDVVENGKSVVGMRVVAGTKENPTPVLSDQMTYLVFSPYWNIPPEILKKETIPALLKDPTYLERNNIEVVTGSGNEPAAMDPEEIDWDTVQASSLRFRQRPGPGNSLGLVKFIFPNHFNVYLHDTPADALFGRIERDFSHGCVRLERPVDLAVYLLRDQPDWTGERIESAMHAGVEQTVKLKKPIPVHLVYFTAWEENGRAHFRGDVYGHDRKQRAAGAS